MKKILLLSLVTTLLVACSSNSASESSLQERLNQPIETENDVPSSQNF